MSSPSDTPPNDRFKLAQNRKFHGITETEWSDEFSFVQLADTQLGMFGPFKSGIKGAGVKLYQMAGGSFDHRPELSADESYVAELLMCELSVSSINAIEPPPKFVIVCGDLINAYPNSKPSLIERQQSDFKRIFEKLNPNIPLVCVCGNHDVGDQPTLSSISTYSNSFGDDYYSLIVRGVTCVVLNSQIYNSRDKDLIAAQDEWLRGVLDDHVTSQRRHLIYFSHISPFIDDQHEPSNYFNIPTQFRQRLLHDAHKAGARKWFAGHFHRNAVGNFLPEVASDAGSENLRAGQEDALEVVVTAAVGTNIVSSEKGNRLGLSGIGGLTLSKETSGLRLVRVTDNNVLHQFFTFAELEANPAALNSPPFL
eukprot:c26225_g1_i1.p1 GENE.c26225_g1_i1~~c26225_g1_i1.p1  ORF type:complete len:367 (-),score=80.37 c26225_g1_i1:53-1153(-)